MLKKTTLTGGLIALLFVGLSATATAQIGISFEKHGRHKGIGINIGGVFGGRHHDRHDRHRHVHTSHCVRQHAGHYQEVQDRVWVPGCERRVWIQPEYRYVVDSCGHRRQILLRQGYWDVVQDEGHYEITTRRVWVPGHTEYVCAR